MTWEKNLWTLFRSNRDDILNNIITYSPESTLQIYGDLKEDHFLHKLLIPVSVTTLKQNAYQDLLNPNKHKYWVDNMINNLGGTGEKVDLNSIDKIYFHNCDCGWYWYRRYKQPS